MMQMDPAEVDAILQDGHGWAVDHIATSKDDIEEVAGFLMNQAQVQHDEETLPIMGMKKNFVHTFESFSNKQLVNEISSDTFKSAINVSKERGTDRRTYKLGELYLNRFMDKDLIGGKITNIGVHNPQQGNYRNVAIEVTKSVYQGSDYGYNKGENKLIKDYIYYDIDKDLYEVDEINRKDAVVLSKIAQHINPSTKYKEIGKYFQIKGW
jgi:hypothetical protein